MLARFELQAFVPVADLERAVGFYGSTLGLERREHVPGLVTVFDAGGSPLRITLVPSHSAAPWTVAGWSVPDIRAVAARLVAAGVVMQRYDGMTDVDGIWTTPGGDHVAWFCDPDGNVLALTEFAPALVPTKVRAVAPVFTTRDVTAALAQYERLGFRTTVHDEGEHPGYGFAERDGVFLHLALDGSLDATRSAAYLFVEDADALDREWQATGVDGRFHAPTDTPYGLREGAYVDPDGNLLRYGSFVSPS